MRKIFAMLFLLALVCRYGWAQTLPLPVRPCFAIALVCRYGWAQTPQSMLINHAGANRNMVVALNVAELFPAGENSQYVSIPAQKNVEALKKFLETRYANQNANFVLFEQGAKPTERTRAALTNQTLVKMKAGVSPNRLAEKWGATVKTPYIKLADYYLFEKAGVGAAMNLAIELRKEKDVEMAEPQLARPLLRRGAPNDPIYPQQWHLKNTAQFSGAVAGIDINVESAWGTFGGAGIRGAGVDIAIVDDGVQSAHPDLSPNLNTALGYDYLNNDNNPNPNLSTNFHGTACAGLAAARGNNGIGVSGSAPEATLIAVRLTEDATGTDNQEAGALGHRTDIVDISSNSWGPDDDGLTLEGPGPLTAAAIQDGALNGRGGKGIIYVWAGGNGRGNLDDGNKDGYVNSIYTISVAALSDQGLQASYSEVGANHDITAPSWSSGRQGIRTTDLLGTNGYNSSSDYTATFSGTSASTPIVSGVVALMLQANPNLGWRDVKEIIMKTAKKISAADASWKTNAGGFNFSTKFGAGLIDATAAVTLAQSWSNLSPMISETANTGSAVLPVTIPDNNTTGVTRTFVTNQAIRAEHVTVTLNINHAYRGDLEIFLTSPAGTSAQLVSTSNDSNDNYANWTFMTTHNWGENAQGTWTLNIRDRRTGNIGSLTAATLTVYGTAILSAPTATFTALPASICQNQSATLTYTGSADASATYVWNCDGCNEAPLAGQGPHVVSWPTAGTKNITLQVTANSLTSGVVTQSVTVKALPTTNFTVSAAQACANEAVTVNYTGNAGAGATYNWNFNGGTATPGTGQGPHTVSWGAEGAKTITLDVIENGCASVATGAQNVQVNPIPTSSFTTNITQALVGQNVALTYTGSASAGAFYNWSFNGGSANPGAGQGPQTVNWAAAGTYTVTLAVTDNNCVSTLSSQTIQVFDPPTATFTALPATVCEGETVTLTYTGNASPSAAYVWNCAGCDQTPLSGQGAHTVSWANAGNKTISLQVIENGFTSTLQTQTVIVNPLPSNSFTLDQATACVGGSVTATYTGDELPTAGYLWNCDGCDQAPLSGQGPHTLTWAAGGTKTVSLIVTENNCPSAPVSQTVAINPNPTANFTANATQVLTNETVTLVYAGSAGGGATFNWNFDGGAANPGTGGGAQTVSWAAAGTYNVQLTVTESGCTSSVYSVSIQVNDPAPSASAISQYSYLPGGASADLILWLKGEDFDGFNWQNAAPASTVGNASAVLDPGVGTIAGGFSPPVYADAALNGRPVVRFDGNSLLTLPQSQNLNDKRFAAKTALVVFRPEVSAYPNGVVSRSVIYEQGARAGGLNFYIDVNRVAGDQISLGGATHNALGGYFNPFKFSNLGSNGVLLSAINFAQPNYYGAAASYNAPAAFQGAYGSVAVNPANQTGLSVGSFLPRHNGFVGIGAIHGAIRYGASNFLPDVKPETGPITSTVSTMADLDPFRGDMAEILQWNRSLNRSEMIVVKNYLGAKYGFHVAPDATAPATDLDYFTGADQDGYSFDVAGVHRVASTDFKSWGRGDQFVEIQTATTSGALDAGEALLWGHNNNEVVAANTTDVPTGIDNRMNLVWAAQHTDAAGEEGVGNLTLTFRLSATTNVNVGNYADLRLLARDYACGSFAAACANNVALVSPAAFDGTNRTVTFSFNPANFAPFATENGRKVQRFLFTFGSANPAIRMQAGQALRQTAAAKAAEPRWVVYPNPARSQFFVKAENLSGQTVKIKVTDLLGQTVAEKQAETAEGRLQTQIDLSALSSGVYVVQMEHAAGRFHQKLIVE